MTITTREHLEEMRRRIEAEAERNRLRARAEADASKLARYGLALRIIAGQEQCIDNLMSHADIARAALSGGDDD